MCGGAALQQPQLFAVEQRLVIQQRFERLEVFLLPALLERQHKALLCVVGLAKRHQHPAAGRMSGCICWGT